MEAAEYVRLKGNIPGGTFIVSAKGHFSKRKKCTFSVTWLGPDVLFFVVCF